MKYVKTHVVFIGGIYDFTINYAKRGITDESWTTVNRTDKRNVW